VILISAAAAGAWRWWPALDRWQSKVRLRHAVMSGVVSTTDGRPAVLLSAGESPDQWLNGTFNRCPDMALFARAQAGLIPPLARETGPALLFLHDRITPDGHHRVVRIGYSPLSDGDRAYVALDVRLFDPGTLWHPNFANISISRADGLPVSATVPGYPGMILRFARIYHGHSFDLSVGRPDATDDSQVLFDYAVDGRPVRLICRICDGDTVSFRAADGSSLPIAVGPARVPSTR
jgi:hypothetical protein